MPGAFEAQVLSPGVLQDALWTMLADLDSAIAASRSDRNTVRSAVARLDEEVGRLTAAIAAGGQLEPLVDALKDGEAERGLLRRELSRPVPTAAGHKRSAVEAQVREKLADWRGLLHRRVPQARQILRKLLPGKSLMFEPKEGYYEFWAEASVEKLLEGVLPRTVASPAGFEPAS